MGRTLDEYIQEMTGEIHLQHMKEELPGQTHADVPLTCHVLPEYGDGLCHIIRISAFASVLLIDACFREEVCISMPCDSFYYFSYYYLLEACLHHPDGVSEQLQPYTLYTNAGYGKAAAETVFLAGKAVRGLIVVLSPEGYRNYLSARLPEYSGAEIDSLLSRLYKSNGIKELSGLAAIYSQISSFRGNGIIAQLFAESKFNELIALFLQGSQQNRKAKKNAPGNRIKAEDFSHIAAVKQHLAAHLEGPLNMAALARIACMSQSKLKYCFREATGFSVSDWRQRLRMQKARELLLTTALPVYEIAARTGYRKAGSFSEAFTRSEGISPSEFRRVRHS